MQEQRRVVIGGIDIPFADITWFLVKLVLATVPATLVAAAIGGAIYLTMQLVIHRSLALVS